MGIIISAITIVSNSIKKARDKHKTKKLSTIAAIGDRDQSQIPSSTTQQQPRLVSEQQQAEAALQVEHLASTQPIYTPGPHIPGTGEEEAVPKRGDMITSDATTANPSKDPKQVKMASDEDYAAFLDKANEDPNGGGAPKTQSSGKVELKAVDSGVKVPAVLQKVEAYYVSDADEEFVPVCLKLSAGKGLPDEKTFVQMVNHPSPKDADVSIMDIGEWDPRGQYKEVVDAVREAGKGNDVRVYRIAKGGTRVEYWVVSVEDAKLVGVKALAIES